MKVIITEANIKNLLINKLGIDLTDKVETIKYVHQLPKVFLELISQNKINEWLKQYGPMYLIRLPYRHILYQPQPNGWSKSHSGLLLSRNGNSYTDNEFLDILGIPPMGITIQDIIDTFVKEED